jgi:hypothetical protein
MPLFRFIVLGWFSNWELSFFLDTIAHFKSHHVEQGEVRFLKNARKTHSLTGVLKKTSPK